MFRDQTPTSVTISGLEFGKGDLARVTGPDVGCVLPLLGFDRTPDNTEQLWGSVAWGPGQRGSFRFCAVLVSGTFLLSVGLCPGDGWAICVWGGLLHEVSQQPDGEAPSSRQTCTGHG